jgi:23S rRNA (guanine2445-N2)-methyltransferase / 23S rRNA (guanine2069-N7)-methyltransferase
MTGDPLDFFATCPPGTEHVLADELRALHAVRVRVARAGVSFSGVLADAYRACLWSRVASRVLMPLVSFQAASADELYVGARSIAWTDHVSPDGTIAVDFGGATPGVTNSMFGALKVKDAIVDVLRDAHGRRPSVDTTRPGVRVNVRARGTKVTVSLDLSGDALHRRGYRQEGVQAEAPLKENLAAAMLLLAEWPHVAYEGGAFIDPMCGSGTLPIEAAWIAGDVAPGLLRGYFGFSGWLGHDADAWHALLDEADERAETGRAAIPPVAGYDIDPKMVALAQANAGRAGLLRVVTIERKPARDLAPLPGATAAGLIAVNPPYGERLGQVDELRGLYAELGERLRAFHGWQAAVLTSSPQLAGALGMPAPGAVHDLHNGTIPVRLLRYRISEHAGAAAQLSPSSGRRTKAKAGGAGSAAGASSGAAKAGADGSGEAPRTGPVGSGAVADAGAEAFANRLRKDLKHLGKWARRTGTTCWRVYDADLPDYSLAIDLYHEADSGERWVHVAEYEAPATVDPVRAASRVESAMAVMPEVLDVPRDRLVLKVRKRQKGVEQYERMADERRFIVVREGEARLLVNLEDYLDTGLFLDHRTTRAMVAALAAGKRFLNLFAYTGAATVQAMLAGALTTTSVDMSATYTDWARRNAALNGIAGRSHEFVQADCVEWLAQHAADRGVPLYDVIFLDPPTFSNSKRMDGTFDVQRDHVALLRDAGALLAPGGVLVFSTNNRRFTLDTDALPELVAEDITAATIPQDFARNPRIHRCFRLVRV